MLRTDVQAWAVEFPARVSVLKGFCLDLADHAPRSDADAVLHVERGAQLMPPRGIGALATALPEQVGP